MKCIFCGGELRHETVTFSYEDGEMHILVEHVPADVCARCGERMYAPEATDALLRLARQQSEPVRMVHIPVYDFSQVAAAQECLGVNSWRLPDRWRCCLAGCRRWRCASSKS